MQTNFQTLTQLFNTLKKDAQTNPNRYITLDYLHNLSNKKKSSWLLAPLIADILDAFEIIDGKTILQTPKFNCTLANNPNPEKLLYDYESADQGLSNLKPYTFKELIDEIEIMDIAFG